MISPSSSYNILFAPPLIPQPTQLQPLNMLLIFTLREHIRRKQPSLIMKATSQIFSCFILKTNLQKIPKLELLAAKMVNKVWRDRRRHRPVRRVDRPTTRRPIKSYTEHIHRVSWVTDACDTRIIKKYIIYLNVRISRRKERKNIWEVAVDRD